MKPNRYFVLFLFCVLPAACGETDAALAAYLTGNFEQAVPLLEAAAVKAPDDAKIQAALLSSMVSGDKVDRAADLVKQLATRFPSAPEVQAARGEFALHMGDMPEADHLFRAALKGSGDEPRATLGMARIMIAASYYKSARLLIMRAHQVAPDDALITRAFLRYLPRDRRRDEIGRFAATHPWLYSEGQIEADETMTAVEGAVGDKKLFERDGPPQETTLHFNLLMRDATRPRGVGLEIKIDDGRAIRMLFDTGASGILLKQSAVDKAGLKHLGGEKAWGVGDGGNRNTFAAVSDSCQIGPLRFRNCLVRALEGKRQIAGDEDGLIGADFFQDYVVAIDFQRKQLHLKPLPPRPESPQGYDRAVPPEESGFTPVFRFGHMLFVSTTVNKKSTGLFLIDTGAGISNIDSTFARLSTKLHGDSYMQVRGVSGNVKNVFEAENAELHFAHFQQQNLGLTAFDMNTSRPDKQSVRMAGVLGMPILQLFRLTIDYRNGLVNFDYVLK